jgi:hypothetical protein
LGKTIEKPGNGDDARRDGMTKCLQQRTLPTGNKSIGPFFEKPDCRLGAILLLDESQQSLPGAGVIGLMANGKETGALECRPITGTTARLQEKLYDPAAGTGSCQLLQGRYHRRRLSGLKTRLKLRKRVKPLARKEVLHT